MSYSVGMFKFLKNYKEFSKNRIVSLWYVLVWSEEEFNKFLDDFEALKVNYLHMDVPTKVGNMEIFEKLGGAPKYVLCSSKSA